MRVRASWVVMFATMVLFSAGCGKSEGPKPKNAKATTPVKGTVTIDGSPVAGVGVLFVPAGDAADTVIDDEFVVAHSATTDAEGKFSVSTYVPGDGVPPGDYNVVFRWVPGPLQPNPPNAAALKAFSKKYGNPGKSEIKQNVGTTPVDMPAIELKTK